MEDSFLYSQVSMAFKVGNGKMSAGESCFKKAAFVRGGFLIWVEAVRHGPEYFNGSSFVVYSYMKVW